MMMKSGEMPKGAGERLLALDILRGLDMFFLTVVGPVMWAAGHAWKLPAWVQRQLTHVAWEGLTAWDLIMPWFIFMCGAAIPFALPKRLEAGRAGWRFWGHVLWRVSMLWVLGMVVQGNLLTLDWERISPYNNTLQTIAAGYLIGAVALLLPRVWMRVALAIGLMASYGLLLACLGDYSETGNFAIQVERWLLPSSSDNYSWCLTTLMFGAMTLVGMLCTELLRTKAFSAWRRLGTLVGAGFAVLGGGWLLGVWEPAIKRIFTVSFTLQALGWGMLALAALYLLADVLRIRRGWGLLTLYGQHALMAYLVMECFGAVLNYFVSILTQGVPHLLGEAHAAYYPLIHALTMAAILTWLLHDRAHHRR